MPRPTILTPAVVARVVSLVEQGKSAAEIADAVGCTLGTLRVRCSQFGISLRRGAHPGQRKACAVKDLVRRGARPQPNSYHTAALCPGAGMGTGKSTSEPRVALNIVLPQITADQLRQRAALKGVSGATLAAELLITIARDSLYQAVLDEC